MLWLPLSLLSAFSQATTDSLTKKALDTADVYAVSWLRNLLAVPFLVVAAAVFSPETRPDRDFFVAISMMLPLEIISTLLYTKAIKVSPLSLTMPFLAFTPIYLLLTSFLILGETPTPAGATGVVLLGAGAYLLNADTMKAGGLLAPLRAIRREKGSMMMMAVAAIFAVTSDLSKVAVQHSSPLFFSAAYLVAFSILFTPLALFKTRTPLRELWSHYGVHTLTGGALALTSIAQNLAILHTNVSYMIAVKRTSLLFSMGYGHFMFHEKNMRTRLLGGAVMVIGVAVMALS